MLFALIDISPFENINRLFVTTNTTLLQATVICYPAYLNWFEVKSIKEYLNEHQCIYSYLSDMYTAWANRSIHPLVRLLILQGHRAAGVNPSWPMWTSRQSITPLTYADKQPFTPTYTLNVFRPHRSSCGEVELEHLEETHRGMGRPWREVCEASLLTTAPQLPPQ